MGRGFCSVRLPSKKCTEQTREFVVGAKSFRFINDVHRCRSSVSAGKRCSENISQPHCTFATPCCAHVLSETFFRFLWLLPQPTTTQCWPDEVCALKGIVPKAETVESSAKTQHTAKTSLALHSGAHHAEQN